MRTDPDDPEANRSVRTADPTNDRSDARPVRPRHRSQPPSPWSVPHRVPDATHGHGRWHPTFAGCPTPWAASSSPRRPAGPRRTRRSCASRADLAQTMSNQLAFQMALIEALMAEPPEATPAREWTLASRAPRMPSRRQGHGTEARSSSGRRTRAEAVRSTATSASSSPSARSARCSAPSSPRSTRTRRASGCPDEPLMLVDRILTIEGEPRSLTQRPGGHRARRPAGRLVSRRRPDPHLHRRRGGPGRPVPLGLPRHRLRDARAWPSTGCSTPW